MSKKQEMSDDELRSLVSEVQNDLTNFLQNEQTKLAKANPGEATSSELPPDDSATDGDSGSASPPPSGSSGGPPPDASASGGPPGDSGGPPPGGDPSGDPSGGGDPMGGGGEVDPEQLKAELSAMPDHQLKTLYMALKEVLFQKMSAGGGDPSGGGGPPGMDPSGGGGPPPGMDASGGGGPPGMDPSGGGGPPGPPPPEDSSSRPPALKNEMVPAGKSVPKLDANGGQESKGKVIKSESRRDAEITALQKKVSEYDEVTTVLINMVEKVISVPARRAVAGISEIRKSESTNPANLSKAEINERLGQAARNTKLTKSDRERIVKYTIGTIGLEKVQDLLDVK